MQRYHGGSCTSAVNNSTIGGPSARDSSRVDSASLPPNFSRKPPHMSSIFMKVSLDHKDRGNPKILIQTQSLAISAGQHPVVGLHHCRSTGVFFQTHRPAHRPARTCSAAFLDGSSNKN